MMHDKRVKKEVVISARNLKKSFKNEDAEQVL